MNEPVQYPHICADCGKKFLGGKNASFCYDCRRRHSGESAKRRRLCDIGAKARWGKHRKGGRATAQEKVEGKEIGKCEPVN